MFRLIRRFIGWTTDSVLRTVVSVTILGGVAFGVTHAATTYNVQNVPDMTLNTRTTTTGTTGIKVNWPRRNGVQVAFPTVTGGVLEIAQGTKVEHIYYSLAVNNTTAKTFTLSGTVIRNLDWNECSSYVSDGDGQIFTPGAKVRLVVDCRLLNISARKDQSNTFTTDGGVSFSGSGSLGIPTFATTAERDLQLGANPTDSNVLHACVTATGLCYKYIGGAWVDEASGTTPNATEAIAGKVELGTIADMTGATLTGTTGAATVVQTQYLTMTGATTNKYGKIPVLGRNGTLTGSMLGTGTADSTTYLRGDGAWSFVSNSFDWLIYGYPSDGDLTLSANATMTADKRYGTVRLNGFTLTMSGYVLRAETITGSGKLLALTGGNGGNGEAPALSGGYYTGAGAGGAAGAAPSSGTLPKVADGTAGAAGGVGAQAGGTTANATAGAQPAQPATITGSVVSTTGADGGAGAAGGAANPPTRAHGAGGASQSGGLTTLLSSIDLEGAVMYYASLLAPTTFDPRGCGTSVGGAGGGGGGANADQTNYRGGGGGGGGGAGSNGQSFFIIARILSGSFTIEGVGGNGGNGGAGGASINDGGGGGGGAGGAGGQGSCGTLIYNDKSSWSGSFVLTGGTGGTGGAGGAGTGGGANGATGSDGSDGNTGSYYEIQV